MGSLHMLHSAAWSSIDSPHRPDPPAAFATSDEDEEEAREIALAILTITVAPTTVILVRMTCPWPRTTRQWSI
jgi:hypothetical protein